MKNIELSEVQQILVNALKHIHSICEKHNIKYWLDSGTLLGAVRNNKFISWDDDIDICMLREDFNKFLVIALSELDKDKYFLQTCNTDPYYKEYDIPCKVRVNNTYIEESKKIFKNNLNLKAHNGFFIDIFPCDKYPNNKFLRDFFQSISVIYKAKSLFFRKSLTKKAFFSSRIIHYIIPINLLNYLNLKVTNYLNNNSKKHPIISKGIELPFHKGNIPQDKIFPLKKIKFEDYYFYGPNNNDYYLTELYGSDYMTPPPLINRVPHSVIFKK
ncbi:TPA: LicD family protein [Proteus mirabilis]|nr:LicD family protein [Proteus mirabilis]